jgi:hypothetical protein
MKMIVFLLLAPTIGFSGSAQRPLLLNSKPKVKTVYNNHLLELATRELTVPHLRKLYGSTLRVSKISRNIHEPAVKDTLLLANTKADQLKFFSNKYNTFLLSAKITSRKLAFGRGIQVGTAKTAFCKAFGLANAFDGYLLADAEGGSSIYFLFRQGVLTSVSYDIGWLD